MLLTANNPKWTPCTGAKVDLVPASDLKPAVRARAERDLVAL
jgi:hypothetical protein